MKALITSPEARTALGETITRQVEFDLGELQGALDRGDMRLAGQQVGKLTGDLVQVAGGIEALARLGVSTASAGGRLVLGAADAVAAHSARVRAVLGSGGASVADDVAARIANNALRDADLFTDVAQQMEAARAAGWRTAEGRVWWPPNDGVVPGSQVQTTLPPGTRLDRFGGTSENATFLSPVGTSSDARALRPGVDLSIRDEFVVLKPFSVEQSNVMPWFGDGGMGMQFNTGKGTALPISELIEKGYLRKVGP